MTREGLLEFNKNTLMTLSIQRTISDGKGRSCDNSRKRIRFVYDWQT